MGELYTIDTATREISVEEYLARFHNPDEVEGYCRACSNYGRQWGCPPFDFEVVELISRYKSVLLVATKITPLDRTIPFAEMERYLRPERRRLEEQLLSAEKRYDGLSCSFIGECLHCDKGCNRPKGLPCCNPHLVRPSLEAYGFDVTKTMSELFDTELKWGEDDLLPEYIVLVCALLHNSPTAEL